MDMIYLWLIFGAIFVIVFTIDLYVTDHRKGTMKVKSALMWTLIWIMTAFAYSSIIYFFYPVKEHSGIKAIEFITGYLVEYSLSVDNLFAFIMIFSVMKIPELNQPKILKIGIIGAAVLRVSFILAGVGLIKQFEFLLYVFGAILIFTAWKMISGDEDTVEPEKNIFVKAAKKLFNVKADYKTPHFFVKEDGKKYATIGFITVLLLLSTDFMFAIDSIPAVISITQDEFVAVTSNVFAVLGLSSLFFALAGILNLFKYLKYGVAFILFFIGIKMIIEHWVHITPSQSLLVIALTLTTSIAASAISKGVKEEIEEEEKKETFKRKSDWTEE